MQIKVFKVDSFAFKLCSLKVKGEHEECRLLPILFLPRNSLRQGLGEPEWALTLGPDVLLCVCRQKNGMDSSESGFKSVLPAPCDPTKLLLCLGSGTLLMPTLQPS